MMDENGGPTDWESRLAASFGQGAIGNEAALARLTALGNNRQGTSLVNVILERSTFDPTELIDMAKRLQSRFEFGLSTGCPTRNLFITEVPMNALYVLDPSRGVTVSAWQCGPIARCIGLSSDEFLLLCSLSGLVQLLCLELNPLLIPEDLLHRMPSTCLFAIKQSRTQLLLSSEVPRICHLCRDFYGWLGLGPEIRELNHFLEVIS